jgi:hypothetical protein
MMDDYTASFFEVILGVHGNECFLLFTGQRRAFAGLAFREGATIRNEHFSRGPSCA